MGKGKRALQHRVGMAVTSVVQRTPSQIAILPRTRTTTTTTVEEVTTTVSTSGDGKSTVTTKTTRTITNN